MSIAILGSGAFGTALAISLSRNGPVTLWAREAGQAADMARRRENLARLPGHHLPDPIVVTANLSDIVQAETVLLAIPTQQLRSFLDKHQTLLNGKTLVACCKGVEIASGLGPVSVIRDACPASAAAILTGPSFAADIASGLPTALTIACSDDYIGKTLQQRLSTANLRLYRTRDTIGAELGGALKNVVAIACGVAMGARLGESARAALMTRGFAEMKRLARHHMADPDTLSGLSGFGDLVLTCTSEQSRNYRLGLSIGRGEEFDPAVTVEGAATALAVHALAERNSLDLPIASAVAALLEKRLDVASAMAVLLARPLKEE